MSWHQALIAVSCLKRGMEVGWDGGGPPVWLPAGNLCEGKGCLRRSWQGKQIPWTPLGPISQRGLGLVLRIIQNSKRLAREEKSENKSLCRGLGTQELGLPDLHLSWPGLRGSCQVGPQGFFVWSEGSPKAILYPGGSRWITAYERDDRDSQEGLHAYKRRCQVTQPWSEEVGRTRKVEWTKNRK